MKNTLDFLKALKGNNNREWFHAHKDEYLVVKKEIEDFTSNVISALTDSEPQASLLSPSDCLYRIYRDTRFSADKTPYKTHIGIYINPRGIHTGGKKSEYCGYYIHIEPGNSFVAGGAWYPPAPLLKEYRKEIYDNIEEYLEILNGTDFSNSFSPLWQDPLKTAPKGFPKDWEHIEYLKPRSFTFGAPLSERVIASKSLVSKVASLCKILKPLDDFFNFTIEEHPELANCREKK